MDNTAIAIVCHEANRAYCETLGDTSQTSWNDAPDWQKEGAIKGVSCCIDHHAAPMAIHEAWMQEMEKNGWAYGLLKDPEKKTHPCMIPYYHLPVEHRRKDALFKAIVDALTEE